MRRKTRRNIDFPFKIRRKTCVEYQHISNTKREKNDKERQNAAKRSTKRKIAVKDKKQAKSDAEKEKANRKGVK